MLYEEDFPSILFPVDGDIFEIEEKQCLVIGGAYSVDKIYRLRNGWNWWPDEQPTPTIKAYVEEQIKEKKVDVVFSHTCPFKYIPTECLLLKSISPAWITVRSSGWIPLRKCLIMKHGIWDIGILTSE